MKEIEGRGGGVDLFASVVVCLCLRRPHPPPMVILQVSTRQHTCLFDYRCVVGGGGLVAFSH